MYDHVMIRVSDQETSESFYRTVLGSLQIEPDRSDGRLAGWGEFLITQSSGEHPPTRHLHIGFVAASRQAVDEFWRAGIDAGYPDDGPPGERPQYSPAYYGAFLLDPDGNSIEAVHHEDVRRGGHIDHLWVGVSDLESAARFYRLIAPHTGLRPGAASDVRAPFRGAWATLSLVADGRRPTQDLHIAFPAPDRETVADFHAAATAAGYRDNGGPGERLQYQPGYFAAFVLDPDGNNIESVIHEPR
jgi:catechol 2,3-dioxygenase-like lactoylglutathione lyase family enzyme